MLAVRLALCGALLLPASAHALDTTRRAVLFSQTVLPLDRVPAPSAAISFRRLLKSYRGPLANLKCIASGTAQDFSPDRNGAFPLGQALTFCPSGVFKMVTGYDQIGANNWANTTDANRPVVILNAAGMHYRPAMVTADNSAQGVTIPHATAIDTLFASAGGSYVTTAALGTVATPIANDRIWDKSAEILRIGTTAKVTFQQTASGTGGSWGTLNATTGVNVVSVGYSSANLANVPTIRFDGVDQALTNLVQPTGTVNSDAATGVRIASTSTTAGYPGYLSEFLVWKTAPSLTAQAVIESNQVGYWKTPPAVSAGPPLDLLATPVTAAVKNAGGSGCAVNDLIGLGNGTVIKVVTLSGSAVATSAIADTGEWGGKTLSNPVSQVWTNNGCTGVSFDLTLQAQAAFAYGLIRMRAGYVTNKSFDLTRDDGGSTPSTTIGFVGDTADVAAANAFCAAGDTTKCYVTRIYDQTGNTCDAIQATLANAPVWNSSRALAINGVPPIMFNPIPEDETSAGFPSVMKWMSIASPCFDWTPGNPTSVFVVGQQDLGRTRRSLFRSTDGADIWAPSRLGQIRMGMINTDETTGVYFGTLAAQTQPSVMGFVWQGGTITGYNGAISGTNSLAADTAKTGAILGSNESTYPAAFAMVGAVGFNTTISTANIGTLRSVMAGSFGVNESYQDVFVQDGDSGSTDEFTAPYTLHSLAVALLGKRILAYNSAQYGNSLYSTLVNGIASHIQPLYANTPAGGNFVVAISAGENDLRGGADAQTIYCHLQYFVQQVQAFGANAKVAVGIYPLQADILANPTFLAIKMSYDSLRRAGWRAARGTVVTPTGGAGDSACTGGLGADALYDMQSDPTIGVSGQYASYAGTGYFPDGKHMGWAALPIAAQVLATAVSSLFSH